MTPKEQAISDAISTIEKALSRTLDSVLTKVMGDVFDAGGVEYANALQRAMQSVTADHIVPKSLVGGATNLQTLSQQENGAQGKDGRAPRGSIRKALVSVFVNSPDGLPATEVVARAMEVDPSISVGGIHNELNRQKEKIYINEDGRWRLIPGLSLGGDYYDLLNKES